MSYDKVNLIFHLRNTEVSEHTRQGKYGKIGVNHVEKRYGCKVNKPRIFYGSRKGGNPETLLREMDIGTRRKV